MSGWKAAAVRKRALSKATFTIPLSALPAWVISLPRSSDRREAFEKTARNRNLTFEYFTAVDGKARDPAHGAPFPEEVSCRHTPGRDIPAGNLGVLTSAGIYGEWDVRGGSCIEFHAVGAHVCVSSTCAQSGNKGKGTLVCGRSVRNVRVRSGQLTDYQHVSSPPRMSCCSAFRFWSHPNLGAIYHFVQVAEKAVLGELSGGMGPRSLPSMWPPRLGPAVRFAEETAL